MLFDELNHRTKNNMQILQSLLMIAAREPIAQKRARCLRMRASVLPQWSRHKRCSITPAMSPNAVRGNSSRRFVRAVQRAFGKNITVLYEPASGQLPRDFVMPLALILNELLTNAVKYGVNCRGEVSIKVGLARKSGIVRAHCRG